jgi:hypothetical protein
MMTSQVCDNPVNYGRITIRHGQVAASRYFSMNRRTSSSGIFTSANRSISFRGNGNRYCWPGRSPIAGKPTSRDASLATCGSGSACALSISNPIWTISDAGRAISVGLD